MKAQRLAQGHSAGKSQEMKQKLFIRGYSNLFLISPPHLETYWHLPLGYVELVLCHQNTPICLRTVHAFHLQIKDLEEPEIRSLYSQLEPKPHLP